MGLTRETVRELRSELVNLHRQRSGVDARIQGIELILSLRLRDVADAGEDPHRQGSAVELLVVAQRQRGAQGSLRSKLTDILRQKSGLKTADLADRLHRDGFRVGGATGLRNRVSHELSRLRRLKVVQRRRGGRFALTAAKAEDDSAATPEPSPTEATA